MDESGSAGTVISALLTRPVTSSTTLTFMGSSSRRNVLEYWATAALEALYAAVIGCGIDRTIPSCQNAIDQLSHCAERQGSRTAVVDDDTL